MCWVSVAWSVMTGKSGTNSDGGQEVEMENKTMEETAAGHLKFPGRENSDFTMSTTQLADILRKSTFYTLALSASYTPHLCGQPPLGVCKTPLIFSVTQKICIMLHDSNLPSISAKRRHVKTNFYNVKCKRLRSWSGACTQKMFRIGSFIRSFQRLWPPGCCR